MTDKELRKLSRTELMEMLLTQGRQIRELEEKLAQAEQALQNRELHLQESGTLAEAALKLSGVFEAADAACKLYLENIQRLNEKSEKTIGETHEKEETT